MRIAPPSPTGTPPPSYRAAQRMAAASQGQQDTETAESMEACDEAWRAWGRAMRGWLRRLAMGWLR